MDPPNDLHIKSNHSKVNHQLENDLDCVTRQRRSSDMNIPHEYFTADEDSSGQQITETSQPTELCLSSHSASSKFSLFKERRQLFVDAKTTLNPFLPAVSDMTGSGGAEKGLIKSSKLCLFCESTSIRGIQKISKSHIWFLRCLWLTFMCLMTSILLSGTASLIYNYQLYETAWHSKIIMDDKDAVFPDITLCSHIPFSLDALKYWSASDEQHIMTPMEFQQRLFNVTLTALNAKEHTEMRSLLLTVASYDNIDTYYSSLSLEETKKVGHGPDMLFLCVVYEAALISVDEKCDLAQFRVRQMSHNEYLNCYTIEPSQNHMSTIERINIIVKLVPAVQLKHYLNKAFYMEAFNRGEGLKLVIHEHGTYPDFGRKGFNIEPGKMNEITYETIKSQLIDTPVKTCVNNESTLQDLENTFNYTQEHCLDNFIQTILINNCSCQYSTMTRPQTPDMAPYCFSFPSSNYTSDEMSKKYSTIACALRIIEQISTLKEKAQKTVCFPRCNFVSYKTKLSITQWNPASNILDMMTSVTNIYSDLEKNSNNETSVKHLESKLHRLLTGSLTSGMSSRYTSILNNSNAFTYINLKRSSFDSTLTVEKLVLNRSIMASRIGGLCSLCIGLTAAFVCEIIEFVYLSIFGTSSTRISSTAKSNVDAAESVRLTEKEISPNNDDCDTHRLHVLSSQKNNT